MERIMHLERARRRAKESGFTLVELAIVLVIIGLIIGGVLVGQDLIKAAEIRATVSQIEGYNAAVNTFRTKYKGLPGDIRNIGSFFDTSVGAGWENLENGDGDRQLEVCGTAVTTCAAPSSVNVAAPLHSGEALQFWHHLSASELVPGFYNGCPQDAATCVDVPADEDGALDRAFPRSKLDRNGIGVFADGGANYYQIGIAETSATAFAARASLTPQEAFDLDSKMDDGRPGTGAVVVRSAQAASYANDPVVAADGDAAATPTTSCITEDVTATAATTWEYALTNTNLTCSLRFKMN